MNYNCAKHEDPFIYVEGKLFFIMIDFVDVNGTRKIFQIIN